MDRESVLPAPRRWNQGGKSRRRAVKAWLLEAWLRHSCVIVTLSAVALLLLTGRPLAHTWCGALPGACESLPLWLSGLHWIPLNDVASARSSLSVFDGFVAKYHCTPQASSRSHTPSILFDHPVVGPNVSSHPGTSDTVDLLVGVLSSCHGSSLRTAVRDTWQRIDTRDVGTWRAVFIVGNCKDMLRAEQAEHGDILFTNPVESYYSLTAKVLDFFDFAATSKAKFVMKTDDDTFVFIDRLLQELKGMQPSCLYWGSSDMGNLPSWNEVYGGVEAPGRRKHVLAVPTVKWYIPADDFRLLEKTRYMAGGGYILSKDLVAQIAARNITVPSHLPEDATMSALLGPNLVNQCLCADSRHLKDVDEFQGNRLIKSKKWEALPCELSNIAHRTITIHGMRNPDLHHDILRFASSPRETCPGQIRPGNSKGILFADPSKKWEYIWGRQLPPLGGHSIYMQADTYNHMIGVSGLKDRPINWSTLLHYVKQQHLPLNPRGFENAAAQMKAENQQPNPRNLISMRAMIDPAVELPWCVRLDWATKLATTLAELDKHKLLLCDLSLETVYVNASTFRPVISAGRAPWTYRDSRFHSKAYCFSDVQCHACFKTEANDTMQWLPEAKCNMETNRCMGFDANSQAVSMIRKVLTPMLDADDTSKKSDSHRKVARLLSHLSEAPREDTKFRDTRNSIVSSLIKGLQNVRNSNSMKRCFRGQSSSVRVLVQWVKRKIWENPG